MSYLFTSKQLNRKVRRKFDTWEGLSIISLVDVLTILLVFLIKNVSIEGQKYAMPNNMLYPPTMAKRDLLEKKGTTVIKVFKDRIQIGDQGEFGSLNEFMNDVDKRKQFLNLLQLTALDITKEKDAKGNPKTPAALLIQADKSIECRYITELVKLGTSSYYDYIYFATLLDTNWLENSPTATNQ